MHRVEPFLSSSGVSLLIFILLLVLRVSSFFSGGFVTPSHITDSQRCCQFKRSYTFSIILSISHTETFLALVIFLTKYLSSSK